MTCPPRPFLCSHPRGDESDTARPPARATAAASGSQPRLPARQQALAASDGAPGLDLDRYTAVPSGGVGIYAHNLRTMWRCNGVYGVTSLLHLASTLALASLSSNAMRSTSS